MLSFLRKLCSSRLRQLQSRAHAWICHPALLLNNIGFFVNCEETRGKTPWRWATHLFVPALWQQCWLQHNPFFRKERWASVQLVQKSQQICLTNAFSWHILTCDIQGQDVCDRVNPMFVTDHECCLLPVPSSSTSGMKKPSSVRVMYGPQVPYHTSDVEWNKPWCLGGQKHPFCSSASMSTIMLLFKLVI